MLWVTNCKEGSQEHGTNLQSRRRTATLLDVAFRRCRHLGRSNHREFDRRIEEALGVLGTLACTLRSHPADKRRTCRLAVQVPWGCYADLAVVPAQHLAKIHDGMSYTDAAALCLTGGCLPVPAFVPAPAHLPACPACLPWSHHCIQWTVAAASGAERAPQLSPCHAALTAHQALAAARLRPGQRVLAHAAAGGVGSAAVQLAKAQGLEVGD